jgi:hypothetical protein
MLIPSCSPETCTRALFGCSLYDESVAPLIGNYEPHMQRCNVCLAYLQSLSMRCASAFESLWNAPC